MCVPYSRVKTITKIHNKYYYGVCTYVRSKLRIYTSAIYNKLRVCGKSQKYNGITNKIRIKSGSFLQTVPYGIVRYYTVLLLFLFQTYYCHIVLLYGTVQFFRKKIFYILRSRTELVRYRYLVLVTVKENCSGLFSLLRYRNVSNKKDALLLRRVRQYFLIIFE